MWAGLAYNIFILLGALPDFSALSAVVVVSGQRAFFATGFSLDLRFL